MAEYPKKYPKKKALKFFRKQLTSSDRTFAQALYRRFMRETFNNPENSEKLKTAQNARESVALISALIKETADKYFSSVMGNPELSDVFYQELETQRQAKQDKIKQDALDNGMVLWHATPLSKEELDGGVLKGTTERPDLMWEKVFTGVCAFPHSNGAYAIKKAKDEHDFACKGENLVRLTDNRLDGKKPNEVLGYIHGHKLTPNDGFVPTVALDGSVPGEWTTEKEVSIDETKEVTLNSLRQNGVHIFVFDKNDNDMIKKLAADKSIEQQISLFEDMAAHPERTYVDREGNSRKIKVKDYYNQVKNQTNMMMLSAKKSLGNVLG